MLNFYRPQRSCGQGNIFTPVCHSFCSEGGCLPQCMLGYHLPPREQTPLGAEPPMSRPPPRDQTHTPGADTTPPPGKLTPEYGLRAAGTHPTGMHSCSQFLSFCGGRAGRGVQNKVGWQSISGVGTGRTKQACAYWSNIHTPPLPQNDELSKTAKSEPICIPHDLFCIRNHSPDLPPTLQPHWTTAADQGHAIL